ncbi:MAG TPA: flagellar biosynthetic protein FliR, partial [Parvularculaceae bacterium]|nr:flagellar biosynthetic protein FliR [Parvularculaceae bacterium]
MDILDSLLPLVRIGVGPIFIVAGVFTRISALIFFLPGLGEATVSMRVRLGAAIAIALILAPIVMAKAPPAPQSAAALAYLIAAEAVAGALIGFSIRVAIFAVQTAGSIAAQSLSLAQLFAGGIDSDSEPPVATLLMIAAIALAAATGVHFKAVSALAYSYDVMPFGAF